MNNLIETLQTFASIVIVLAIMAGVGYLTAVPTVYTTDTTSQEFINAW